jgi:phospholipid/cholesterol/gamma-HCH transport system ATP-binding protein
MRRFGILYQGGALWSSMTLAENVGLPLGEFTDLKADQMREIAMLKLALVGLKGFEDYVRNQISGGMQKQAGIARAMALDPEILFFDEPSAGLDPVSSRFLDNVIPELHYSLGTTIVVVTHESWPESSRLATTAFSRRGIAYPNRDGRPKELRHHSDDPRVVTFLTRGEKGGESIGL